MPFDYPEEEQDEVEAPPQRAQRTAGLFPARRVVSGSDPSSARFLNDPANGLNDAQFQRRYEAPPIPISKPGIGQRIVAMGQWREPFAIQEGQKQDEQKDIGQRIVQMGRQPMDSSAVPRLSLMSGASSSQLVSDNPQQGKDLFTRFVPPNSEPSANLQPNVRQLSNSFSGPNGGFRSMSQTAGLRQRSREVANMQRPIPQVSALAKDGLGGSAQQPQQAPLDWQSPILGLTKEISEYLKWRDANFRLSPDGRWEAPSARLYTDEELHKLYADQKQQARWAEQARERQRQATAQSQGRTVTITYPDGEKERRKGNHPQRDNNPGNMETGRFTRNHGEIGKDLGFAVFPSADTGWAAMDSRLRSDDLWNLSIDQAIYAWAPPRNAKGQVINDTAEYQRKVRAALGVTGDTRISALTPEQFETLKQTIAQIEGFYEKRPNKKIDVVIEVPKRPSVIPR